MSWVPPPNAAVRRHVSSRDSIPFPTGDFLVSSTSASMQDALGADRRRVERLRGEVDAIAGGECDISLGRVERDGALDAEQDLVPLVPMRLVAIPGAVRPSRRLQALRGQLPLRDCPKRLYQRYSDRAAG
jgi:hypothetical protein